MRLQFIAFLLCLTAPAQQVLTLEKVLDQRRISDLRFSPDGKKLAFVVDGPIQGTRSPSHIWMLDVASGNLRQFTSSETGERFPRWSPDGSRLAFITSHNGAPAILYGGSEGGEARPLFASRHRIGSFAWSPDGGSLAFLAPEPLTIAEEKKAAERDDAQLADQPGRRSRLWVTRLQGEDRQPKAVSGLGWAVSEYVWMDGARLLVEGSPKPSEFSGTESLWEANIDGTAWKEWAHPPTPFHRIEISPDRRYLALLASSNNGPKGHDLFVTDISQRKFRNLTAKPIDRFIGESYQWTTGSEILAAAADGFRDRFVRIDVAGKVTNLASPIKSGDVAAGADGTIAWQGGSSADLPELWIQTPGSAPKRVSNFHASWKDIWLPPLEFYRYRSFDGKEMEAGLLRPAKPGRVPLIAYIHGGPASRWRDQYDAFEAWGPLLVAKGFAVFFPNPRGSTGYGEKFMEANRRDWAGADFKDIMAGVDDLVQRGIADPNHLGICGWSYGGYMGAWAITQTNRFRAAVVGNGMFDLAFEMGTESSPIADRWFLGMPYEERAAFERMSPMNYVAKAKTPTLIFQGEGDTTNPAGQSKQFYRGLKFFGVETQLVLYPREGHVFTEEKHILDMYKRMLAWFEKYL